MSQKHKEILIGTTNPGKLEALKKVVAGTGLKIRTEDKLPNVEEDGKNFAENSQIKALAFAQFFNVLTIATDGGIQIPILGSNWNELLTRRFAGNEGADADRIEKLLEMMALYPEKKDRQVFFTEAVSVAEPGKILATWVVDGEPGYLATTWDRQELVRGLWLTNLWIYQYNNTLYKNVSAEEREAHSH